MHSILRYYRVEVIGFAFRWREHQGQTGWSLYVYRGKICRVIRFLTEDLAAWPPAKDAFADYDRRMEDVAIAFGGVSG